MAILEEVVCNAVEMFCVYERCYIYLVYPHGYKHGDIIRETPLSVIQYYSTALHSFVGMK